ncbi:hypothetical protein CRE_07568 [Caenorhabditis remanei]|uniref:F-box domain-containing protein n=1 Tax=Caenorhabditis remanei TaxID=31234 RepID=E3MPA1_CAERE|nr:hypothetical protein CRE_07568 [Caenorhabditis remanei]
MSEATERDPLSTRRHILDEFEKVQAQIATNPELWRILSVETHKELRKALGDDFIDYPEFEFWFSRFARGDFDLDDDRKFGHNIKTIYLQFFNFSSDPKTRSLTDLPLEVFENVGEYLELKDRMHLRNVTKDIRTQVDNWIPKLTEISYRTASSWGVWQTSRSICYHVPNFGPNRRDRPSPGFYRNPISFVFNMLKHPKLKLEKLTIEEDKYWKELIEELDRSNQKVHVKKVEFSSANRDSSNRIDIHYFVPGVLEEISVFFENPSFEVMKEFIELDQCQAAKMVTIRSETCTSKFPMEVQLPTVYFASRWRNSGQFESQFYQDLATSCDYFLFQYQLLQKLIRGGKVEKCHLYLASSTYFFKTQYKPTPFLAYFNEESTMVPDSPFLRRFPIRGTKDFYEIDYQVIYVILHRKQ